MLLVAVVIVFSRVTTVARREKSQGLWGGLTHLKAREMKNDNTYRKYHENFSLTSSSCVVTTRSSHLTRQSDSPVFLTLLSRPQKLAVIVPVARLVEPAAEALNNLHV